MENIGKRFNIWLMSITLYLAVRAGGVNRNDVKELALRLSKAEFDLHGICPMHTVGKVTRDIAGDAFSDCVTCGEELTLKGKSLGDLDALPMSAINALLPQDVGKKSFAISVNNLGEENVEEK